MTDMDAADLGALEDHADWLESMGASATDNYERGRYVGKAEGIRLATHILTTASR